MARFLKKRENVSGAAPGSLIFLGKQKMDDSRVRIFNYNSKSHSEKDSLDIDEIKTKINQDSVTWINIYGLHNTELIKKVGETFSISSLILEDILNTDHRPRIIEDKKHIVVIVKALSFDKNDNKIHTDQISFVLGEDYLITFQERIAEYFEPVRKRIRNKIGRISSAQADYLMYSLIDTLTDNSLLMIELLGEKIEDLDNQLINVKKELAQIIYNYKNEISYIRKNIRPLKEIVYQLHKTESPLIKESTLPFIEDLIELVNQSLESIEIYYTMVSDQLMLYNTFVNNKANEVMKFLTMFASIFIPLTFIVGIYGTNFDNLPEIHLKYGYFGMWGVMITMAVGMLFYFRKKKWL